MLLKRIRTFLAWDADQKAMLVQAIYLTAKVRFLLKRKPFKELVSGLDLDSQVEPESPLDRTALEVARSVGLAVRSASVLTPWNSNCLVQAISAQQMLKKRGIAGTFFLGTSGESQGEETQGFQAHAWLKCNDEFITGQTGHEQYTVVARFSWSSFPGAIPSPQPGQPEQGSQVGE